MNRLSEASEAIDLVTLPDNLHANGELEVAGGLPYVTSIADGLPESANIVSYAKIVKDKAILRRVIEVGAYVQKVALDDSEPPGVILGRIEQRISDLAVEVDTKDVIGEDPRNSAISLLQEFGGKVSWVRVFTGIEKLDSKIGGFRSGELITLTAGTGVGKTLLAQQIKRKACSDGLHGMFFSGEMSAKQLESRELATQAGVPHWKMRCPERLTAQEYSALVAAAGVECSSCLTVDGELSVRKLRMAARRMKQKKTLNWIVIDYDELVDAPGKDEFAQQRAVIREAKRLAMTLWVPVIMISQLRKSLDAKEAKKPTLERLYGSGAKSKHSSFVIFVDREYVRELKGDETRARIFILKARDGSLGEIPATFNLQTLRFQDESEEEKFLRGKKKSTMEKAVAEHQQPQEEEMF